jgi:hypothetical protein
MAGWVVSVHQTWNLQSVFAFRNFLPTIDGDQTKDDSFVVVVLLLGRRGRAGLPGCLLAVVSTSSKGLCWPTVPAKNGHGEEQINYLRAFLRIFI